MGFSIDLSDYISIDNFIELLKNHKISVQDLIEYTKPKKYSNRSFVGLLNHNSLFQELIEDELLSKADLKNLFNNITNSDELAVFCDYKNFISRYIIQHKIVSFQEIVDKCKSIKDEDDDKSYLNVLFCNEDNISYFIKSNLSATEDLRYLWDKIDGGKELEDFNEYAAALMVENKIISFQELVDKNKSITTRDSKCFGNHNHTCLVLLVHHTSSVKKLLNKNLLSTEDLRYLFESIDNSDELRRFSHNTYLLGQMIENGVISFQELMHKFHSVKTEGCFNSYQLLETLNFTYFIEHNLIPARDLRDIFESVETFAELNKFSTNECLSLRQHLLNENIVSFQELVDKYKSIEDKENDPCLYKLLDNEELFKYLIENNKLTNDDLRYLFNKIDHEFELLEFNKNSVLVKHIFENKISTLRELTDKQASVSKHHTNTKVNSILKIDFNIFSYFLKKNLISREELKYLFDKLETNLDLHEFGSMRVQYLIRDKTLSFQELVDKCKNIKDGDGVPYLSTLIGLCSYDFLYEKNETSDSDLRYLLNNLSNYESVHELSRNSALLKRCFNVYLIDKELINKFDQILSKKKGISFFELLREGNTAFQSLKFFRVLKMANDYEKVYSFSKLNKDEKTEILNIIKKSKTAESLRQQIVDSNLEDQYDFETLKELLTKDTEKKKIKLNF